MLGSGGDAGQRRARGGEAVGERRGVGGHGIHGDRRPPGRRCPACVPRGVCVCPAEGLGSTENRFGGKSWVFVPAAVSGGEAGGLPAGFFQKVPYLWRLGPSSRCRAGVLGRGGGGDRRGAGGALAAPGSRLSPAISVGSGLLW